MVKTMEDGSSRRTTVIIQMVIRWCDQEGHYQHLLFHPSHLHSFLYLPFLCLFFWRFACVSHLPTIKKVTGVVNLCAEQGFLFSENVRII